MKKIAVLAAVAMVLTIMAIPASAADVSGNWKSKMETPRGTMERTLQLKQDGDKLTGAIVMKRGDQDIKQEIKDGKVTGDSIEFKVDQRMGQGGDTVSVTYKLKVTGNKMEGTSQAGDREPRPFTATKE